MRLTIEIPDKTADFLKEFAQKQYEGAKDNVGIRTPIHVVERLHEVFIEDDLGEVWLDADNEYAEYNSFGELIDARRKAGENLPPFNEVEFEEINDVWIDDKKAYCQAYKISAVRGKYIIRTRPIAFFLILDEAKRYKNGYQKHNCGDCRIYTYGSGYSNQGDLPYFRELLMNMGQALLEDV